MGERYNNKKIFLNNKILSLVTRIGMIKITSIAEKRTTRIN